MRSEAELEGVTLLGNNTPMRQEHIVLNLRAEAVEEL